MKPFLFIYPSIFLETQSAVLSLAKVNAETIDLSSRLNASPAERRRENTTKLAVYFRT
jgi:hypothetical protein